VRAKPDFGYLNAVTLSIINLTFFGFYPSSLSESPIYARPRQNGFYVIVALAAVLLGPTKILQCTCECGFWLISLFGPSKILCLIVNEYLGLEFWLDQPKICSLVVNVNFCS
jgi:hypothetical protein